MPDYEKMYFGLFNQVTDAIRALEKFNPSLAREILIKAQRKAEEQYISAGEANR